MTAFEFVDELPPGRRTDPSVFMEYAAALKSRPGAWCRWPVPALAATAAGSKAWGINSGRAPAPPVMRNGGFEAKVRAGVLYVRYIGGAA